MTYFLEKIAQTLYDEFGNSLNSHCLVFPNRRAGLYFTKYLAARIDKPVWMPSILTINELFRSFSSVQLAGNEILLFELYKIYRKLKSAPESFDEFYFWGDMLLNDFDDVDKYLVDPAVLFRNIQDLKTIDQQFGGLTEEQIGIIKRFWINFNPDKLTDEKSEFLNIWSLLNDLYYGFRTSLKKQNIAYEGMIFRDLTEKSETDYASGILWEMVHFIGFNALNECEKGVMNRFKKAGKARFYWDYDNSYIKKDKLNSAGFFLKDNLEEFGNNMPPDWSYDTMISNGSAKVRRRVIDASSDVAQVKLISQLINEIPDLTSDNAHHTAVVLADENLLMPVLTSLSENVGDINITMGHPLKQTIVYTLIKNLIDLQRTAEINDKVVLFDYENVITVLKHSLLSGLMNESDKDIINEIVKRNMVRVPSDQFGQSAHLVKIFMKPLTPSLLSVYFKDILSLVTINDETNVQSDQDKVQQNIRNEFIYRVILSINRLETIINSPEVSFTSDTYMRILDKMLRIQSVPFSGEPLSGIQIMGILESRALDFKNLIILSVNEGVLPAVSAGSSFIPYSLREAFGLPSVNHQESIYAYHFYRLLQRAENVTFTYNSNSEGLKSGEMSRFLIQMKYESDMKPDFLDLNFEIKTQGSVSEMLERSKEHSTRLNSLYLNRNGGRKLSPSAINTWLNCRMKFYYRYVNDLREPEKVSKDIDPVLLGNILHEILKNIYSGYKNHVLTEEILKSVINNKKSLSASVNFSINTVFRNGRDGSVSGNELIVRDVLMAYLIRILNVDKSLTPFTILNVEEPFSFILKVIPDGSECEIEIGGKIDRIDIMEGVTRIVDYKTGTVADTVKSIDDLFTDDRKKHTDAWLQILLYCEAYLCDNPGTIIRPSVYAVRKLKENLQTDKLRLKGDRMGESLIDNYMTVREEYLTGLRGIVSTIFNPDEPFVMTKDIRGKCSYCPYKTLCMR